MWILAAEDRLYWLLPNQKYVVGRAHGSSDGGLDIPLRGDSSVSRKHLVLQVKHASQTAVQHPSSRSELLITDTGSRFGTQLDGERIPANEVVEAPQASNGMFSLILGKEHKCIRLKWTLHVVTYLTGQSGEAHNTLFEHALDLANTYDFKLTSHLVSATQVLVITGKATSSLYYALTQEIPVLNTQYLEALKEYALEAQKGIKQPTVLPDVNAYYADPAYRPNPLRKKLLEGWALRIPDQKYAEVMTPIVEATGGVLAEHGIPVYASHEEGSGKFLLGSKLFALIVEARKLNETDFERGKRSLDEPRNEPARKKSKLSVLHMMTSSAGPSKPQKDVNVTPKKNILDLMTSRDGINSETDRVKESTEKSAEKSTEQSTEKHVAEKSLSESAKGSEKPGQSSQQSKRRTKNLLDFITSQELSQAEPPVQAVENELKRKSEVPSSDEPTEPKRQKKAERDSTSNGPQADISKQPKPVSSESEWDFEDLAKLVVVCNEVPLRRSRAPVQHKESSERTNFKGFRRKQTAGQFAPSRVRNSVPLESLSEPEEPAEIIEEEAADLSGHDIVSLALRTQEEDDDGFTFKFE